MFRIEALENICRPMKTFTALQGLIRVDGDSLSAGVQQSRVQACERPSHGRRDNISCSGLNKPTGAQAKCDYCRPRQCGTAAMSVTEEGTVSWAPALQHLYTSLRTLTEMGNALCCWALQRHAQLAIRHRRCCTSLVCLPGVDSLPQCTLLCDGRPDNSMLFIAALKFHLSLDSAHV